MSGEAIATRGEDEQTTELTLEGRTGEVPVP